MSFDNRSGSQHGLSLFSFATALAVLAVAASAALPSFERMSRQWALSRAAQALLAALHAARATAALRGVPVALCQADAPGHCGTATVSGWLLFAERVTSSPVRLDAADELLQAQDLPDTVELRSTRSAVTYWPSARSGTTATFVLCDRRNLATPQVLIISQTGRPRLGTRMSDGSAPDCAHG